MSITLQHNVWTCDDTCIEARTSEGCAARPMGVMPLPMMELVLVSKLMGISGVLLCSAPSWNYDSAMLAHV
jgi:hypothetical protein